LASEQQCEALAPVLPAWPRQRLREQENGTTKLEEPIGHSK